MLSMQAPHDPCARQEAFGGEQRGGGARLLELFLQPLVLLGQLWARALAVRRGRVGRRPRRRRGAPLSRRGCRSRKADRTAGYTQSTALCVCVCVLVPPTGPAGGRDGIREPI